jgi:hypothetical protein
MACLPNFVHKSLPRRKRYEQDRNFAHNVAHTVEALKSRLVHILRTGTVG